MAVYRTTGTSALKNEHPFIVIDGMKNTRDYEEESLRNFVAFSDARQFSHEENITLSADSSKKIGLGILLTSLLTIGCMTLLTLL